jgi:hypothetical protein
MCALILAGTKYKGRNATVKERVEHYDYSSQSRFFLLNTNTLPDGRVSAV